MNSNEEEYPIFFRMFLVDSQAFRYVLKSFRDFWNFPKFSKIFEFSRKLERMFLNYSRMFQIFYTLEISSIIGKLFCYSTEKFPNCARKFESFLERGRKFQNLNIFQNENFQNVLEIFQNILKVSQCSKIF